MCIFYNVLALICFTLLVSEIQRYAPARVIAKDKICLAINPGRWFLEMASANSILEKVRILGTAPAAIQIRENVTILEMLR